MGLALRWVFRHTQWQKQTAKDRRETDEKQQPVRGVVDDLKARIAVKVTEVDKGLKQYELVKRLAEAVSWEEMSPPPGQGAQTLFPFGRMGALSDR